MASKWILKINNSWTELFNFQSSFNCLWLELLRTALQIKTFADNKFDTTQMTSLLHDIVEKDCKKEKMLVTSIFSSIDLVFRSPTMW